MPPVTRSHSKKQEKSLTAKADGSVTLLPVSRAQRNQILFIKLVFTVMSTHLRAKIIRKVQEYGGLHLELETLNEWFDHIRNLNIDQLERVPLTQDLPAQVAVTQDLLAQVPVNQDLVSQNLLAEDLLTQDLLAQDPLSTNRVGLDPNSSRNSIHNPSTQDLLIANRTGLSSLSFNNRTRNPLNHDSSNISSRSALDQDFIAASHTGFPSLSSLNDQNLEDQNLNALNQYFTTSTRTSVLPRSSFNDQNSNTSNQNFIVADHTGSPFTPSYNGNYSLLPQDTNFAGRSTLPSRSSDNNNQICDPFTQDLIVADHTGSQSSSDTDDPYTSLFRSIREAFSDFNMDNNGDNQDASRAINDEDYDSAAEGYPMMIKKTPRGRIIWNDLAHEHLLVALYYATTPSDQQWRQIQENLGPFGFDNCSVVAFKQHLLKLANRLQPHNEGRRGPYRVRSIESAEPETPANDDDGDDESSLASGGRRAVARGSRGARGGRARARGRGGRGARGTTRGTSRVAGTKRRVNETDDGLSSGMATPDAGWDADVPDDESDAKRVKTNDAGPRGVRDAPAFPGTEYRNSHYSDGFAYGPRGSYETANHEGFYPMRASAYERPAGFAPAQLPRAPAPYGAEDYVPMPVGMNTGYYVGDRYHEVGNNVRFPGGGAGYYQPPGNIYGGYHRRPEVGPPYGHYHHHHQQQQQQQQQQQHQPAYQGYDAYGGNDGYNAAAEQSFTAQLEAPVGPASSLATIATAALAQQGKEEEEEKKPM
ncbi:hypothetical protein PFICI_09355 [Pestalotiopsis fici W106-1]|uniref:Uncharacterized protein n=1 Tax=Pestalotiopsis fici (strain W106-1 / CGMCC3.15140) TaxID=1229662 RepID=W3X289_PESFW|nr:uncharacterized protein PFICI_09355 [Pestalotiopsis fici W106-1]ETS79502.1 hypothetical protein PFICI_09355 [Pestalotiopsis fici W106-1]